MSLKSIPGDLKLKVNDRNANNRVCFNGLD